MEKKRNMGVVRGIDPLPDVLTYEVFARLSTGSLLQLRVVRQLWRTYVDDRDLATMHFKRSPETPVPVFFNRKPRRPIGEEPSEILRFLDGTEKRLTGLETSLQKESDSSRYDVPRIKGSCNGLLYMSYDGDDVNSISLIVTQPLRKGHYKLPPIMTSMASHGFDYSHGLGYDESTKVFKMLVFLTEKETVTTMVHVLGAMDSWKNLQQVPTYQPYVHDAGVFANECLHWIGYKNEQRKLIRFHVNSEQFGLLDLPPNAIDVLDRIKLVDINGRLGFVNWIMWKSMELWVLEKQSWIDCIGGWNKKGDILVVPNDSFGGKELYVYNIETKEFFKPEVNGWKNRCLADIMMIQSSLFYIKTIKI